MSGRARMRLLPAAGGQLRAASALRRLRGVAELLRPYRGARDRWRWSSLVLATAASLAPPYLAKLAIDDGITPGDLARART